LIPRSDGYAYGKGQREESGGEGLAAIRGQSHSFSYAQLRARKDERERERLPPAGASFVIQRPVYTSIEQFSQKVELYRGRWGPRQRQRQRCSSLAACLAAAGAGLWA
jgi:hypothetical protein